jgi:hypothetical protein
MEEVLEAARRELLGIPGVVGVSARGYALVVYVETPEDAARVPREFMGRRVRVEVVGRVRLL